MGEAHGEHNVDEYTIWWMITTLLAQTRLAIGWSSQPFVCLFGWSSQQFDECFFLENFCICFFYISGIISARRLGCILPGWDSTPPCSSRQLWSVLSYSSTVVRLSCWTQSREFSRFVFRVTLSGHWLRNILSYSTKIFKKSALKIAIKKSIQSFVYEDSSKSLNNNPRFIPRKISELVLSISFALRPFKKK